MAKPYLVWRTKFSSSVSNNLYDGMLKLSHKTRVPLSALWEEACEDLLKKHKIKVGKNYRNEVKQESSGKSTKKK